MTKTLTAKQKEAMKIGKEKARELSGLVLKVDDDIEIWADKYQFVVHFQNDTWHLPSLEACFEEIFKEKTKVNLVENKKKDIETIVEVIKETAQWLKNIFRNIENPKI